MWVGEFVAPWGRRKDKRLDQGHVAHQLGGLCLFLFNSLKGAGIVPAKSGIDPE